MKKILLFLIALTLLASCKKDIVKTPDHLIEREKMINIMYDLSVLEAIKNQNPSSLEKYNINSKDYIYKKYKIDSIQFVQNNLFYSANYKDYKLMYEEIKSRVDNNVKSTEVLIKIENKKIAAKKAADEKLKLKKAADSIKKSKVKQVKVADSIKKSKLKQVKAADSIKKIKKIKERKLS